MYHFDLPSLISGISLSVQIGFPRLLRRTIGAEPLRLGRPA
jgi:hypothetical protein